MLRVTDLASHFPVVDGESVMILGCHDLTMYNPRSDAVARGWRRQVKDEFRRMAIARGPRVVLQHPHTTIKRMTWRHAWNALRRELPTVRHHASSGRYSREDSGWESRDALAETLDATRSGGVLDIVAHLAAM